VSAMSNAVRSTKPAQSLADRISVDRARIPLCWIVVTLAVCTACGDSSGTGAPRTGSGNATRTSSPAGFAKQAGRICDRAQNRVYALAVQLGADGYPSSFPSPNFASFYRRAATIGEGVVAKLRRLPEPAGEQQRIAAELDLFQQGISFPESLARAAAGDDEARYHALVAGPGQVEAPPPKHPVLPEPCTFFSYGSGE
jgi:hypothetical protein